MKAEIIVTLYIKNVTGALYTVNYYENTLSMWVSVNASSPCSHFRWFHVTVPVVIDSMCYAGGLPSTCVASSLAELCDIRQLDTLFILYTLLAELTGPDSPAYTSYCLTAYSIVIQMWQVRVYCDRGLICSIITCLHSSCHWHLDSHLISPLSCTLLNNVYLIRSSHWMFGVCQVLLWSKT